jgi:hypothetical protein
MLPAPIELLLGSKPVESLQRSSAPGSVSLESSSNDGVYGCPGEEVGRWASTSLARLELLQLPLGNCFPNSTLLFLRSSSSSCFAICSSFPSTLSSSCGTMVRILLESTSSTSADHPRAYVHCRSGPQGKIGYCGAEFGA